MILNNIILIIVLLLLANYLSKGTIITIVLKYYEIFKKYIFLEKEKDNIQDFHYDNETIEDSENTLKLNTLKITDSNSITIDDMNYTTWH